MGDDLRAGDGLVPFPRLAKSRGDGGLSWITFKPRAHRDHLNAKVMKDPRIVAMMESKEQPADMKRTAYGEFKTIVELSGGVMNKIIPHLWFDKEAKEAVNFYTAAFPRSRVTLHTKLSGVPTPTGDCDIVSFELTGHPFMAINAGPLFKFTPAISFIVNFDPSRDKQARKNLDALWGTLFKGGKALMPLDKYPFSERYGWVQDKYGLSWQLILSDSKGEPRPDIVPALLYTGPVAGRAEEASDFYMSVFKGSRRGMVARYGKGQEPDKEGTIMFTDFSLGGQWFAAMDSAREHEFGFNEAVSLLVSCQTQKEIDYYWDKLSADPKAEQCGWLKDRYGVSWQVHPVPLEEMMAKASPEQAARLTQAFLQMKKFDIEKLKEAFAGGKAGAGRRG